MPPIDRSARPRPSRARTPRFAPAAAWLLAAAVLSGCGSFFAPRPDPSRFYVLTATVEPTGARSPASFGVGPITMPEYLKRATIVTRTLPNEITPSSVDRWGEPLDRAVPRILQEDLRRLLGTDQVVIFPWYVSSRPDLQVAIDFLLFERDANGRVTLAARWEIRDPETGAVLRTGETRTSRDPAGAGTSASVAAQSEALGELGRDAAAALSSLAAARPRRGS